MDITEYASRFTVDAAQQFMRLYEKVLTDPMVDCLPQIAYILATIRHETAATFRPIAERGTDVYFMRYDTEPLKSALGNRYAGDGQRFRGRGYVQITGRDNYTRFELLLDEPLVLNPDIAMDEDIAYRIAVQGMMQGLFTGAKLGQYVTDTAQDWLNARRVVNGLDRAATIAAYAVELYGILSAKEGEIVAKDQA